MGTFLRRAFTVISFASCLASCATRVDAPPGSSTQADAGTTGAGGAGGAAPCVPQPYDPDAGFQQPTCADLAVMIVRDPIVVDASGDGVVSPGEGATITVKLAEIAGKGFNMYPGVRFTADFATVDGEGMAQFYAILACQVDDASGGIVVPSNVPKGTVVHVVAQVAMLGAECPDAYAITVPIVVQ